MGMGMGMRAVRREGMLFSHRTGALAVADERAALTYAELVSRARRLARVLRARGAGPERCVALCTGCSMIKFFLTKESPSHLEKCSQNCLKNDYNLNIPAILKRNCLGLPVKNNFR